MPPLDASPEAIPARSTSLQELLCILGGFSVGVLAQQMQQPALAIAATAISLLSLAILTGLRMASRYGHIAARRLELTRAVWNLENRLDRHVSRIPRPHIRRPLPRRPAMDRQYLPVVTSGSRHH